jgi:predicted DNA-binding transcriptional regulator AlpA
LILRENIEQRWLNLRQATHYCGYTSEKYFAQLAREYTIPKHGPRFNRFDRFELDEWMTNRDAFRAEERVRRPRRRGSFTPVHRMVSRFLPLEILERSSDAYGHLSLKEILAIRKREAQF